MQKFWAIGKAKDNTPEILVYGYIGGEDVTSGDFVKELRQLEKVSNKINVRINSAGGSVFEGFAIFNALINSKAEINTYIDGVAASMGSIIALAGKKVYMSKIARFMTHSASGFTAGSANDMRSTAQLLDALDSTLCGIYANKTGKSMEECKTAYLGKEDKWFSAEQAVAEKLVDGIYDADPIEIPKNVTAEKDVWNYLNDHRFAAVFNPSQNKNTDMDKIFLPVAVLATMNLGDNPDQTAVEGKIKDLVAKAAKADDLQAKLTASEQKVKDMEIAANKEKVESILTTALKERKLTAEMSNILKTQYAGRPDDLQALVATMKAYESVVPKENGQGNTTRLEALSAMTYDELDKTRGALAELKALSLDVFKAKFKQHFNKDYTGQ